MGVINEWCEVLGCVKGRVFFNGVGFGCGCCLMRFVGR